MGFLNDIRFLLYYAYGYAYVKFFCKSDSWSFREKNGDCYWYHKVFKIVGPHREDGPAIEYANGQTRYYINGEHIPQLDNKRIYGKKKLEKLLLLI